MTLMLNTCLVNLGGEYKVLSVKYIEGIQNLK